MGRGGRRAASSCARRADARGAARPRRASGSPASRCRRRSSSATRCRGPRPGSCCAGELSMTDEPTAREPRPLGRRAPRLGGRARGAAAPRGDAGLVLDGRRRRPAARPHAARARGGHGRHRPARRRAHPAGRDADQLRRLAGDGERRPAPRAEELGLDERALQADRRRVDRPRGGQRRRRAVPLGLHAAGRPGGRAARDPARAQPGGRVALAAWAGAGGEPVAARSRARDGRRGLAEPPTPGEPGPFAWARPGADRERLEAAGLRRGVEIDRVDFTSAYDSLDEWWETQSTDVGAGCRARSTGCRRRRRSRPCSGRSTPRVEPYTARRRRASRSPRAPGWRPRRPER